MAMTESLGYQRTGQLSWEIEQKLVNQVLKKQSKYHCLAQSFTLCTVLYSGQTSSESQMRFLGFSNQTKSLILNACH